MKRNIINKFLAAGAFVLMGGLVSCEDYLTLYPTDSITKEDFWGSKNDVDNVRNAAYYQLTQNIQKILVWGEYRSDNVELNKTEKTNYRFLQEGVLQPTEGMFDWSAMYKGINFCNEVLDNGERMVRDKVDPAFTESDFATVKSEMIALRALYYFYLVRAFRDVPFVEHSVSTDKEAREARTEATPGAELMGILIKQVEDNLPNASLSLGDNASNKCRFTKNSMHALLADMCLWRAGLVMNSKEKGFPLKGENGAELTKDQEKTLASELLRKAYDYTQPVMAEAWKSYKLYLSRNNILDNDYRANVRYPLYRNYSSDASIMDEPYNMVFGTQNSPESILELHFDGVNVKNTVLSDEFYGNKSGGYVAGTMIAGNDLFNVTEKVDVEKGYGKTDMRMVSYGLIGDPRKSGATPIVKGVNKRTIVNNPKDVREGWSQEYRLHTSQDAHWPVYRLTDIMTIRAEAIARLKTKEFNNPNFSLKEAYELVDDIFRRNNPGADTLIASNEIFSKRIRAEKFDKEEADAANPKKTVEEVFLGRHPAAADAPKYVAQERQRELLGEGKRWFDIVRECEFSYTRDDKTKSGLTWAGLSTLVRNRLQSIWSLYNPIYVDDLKVNGKNYYGNTQGKLVQNPAWEKYMPKTND